MRKSFVLLFLLAILCASAAQSGGQATYVGGTLAAFQSGLKGTIQTASQDAFVFEARTSTLRVPYGRITSVEYGQEANRRVLLALVVSPLFLLLKARGHFVTLHFTDENGKHEVVVLRVDKRLIRAELSTLEAKTGRAVEYQDAEARRYRRS
jgi:hypothetical protein